MDLLQPTTAADAVAGSLKIQQAIRVLNTLNLYAYLYPYDECIQNNTRYDYIIIGGGTSGSVIASRLSEDQNVSVLLLEAGANPNFYRSFDSLLYLSAGLDGWNYKAQDANYRKCHRDKTFSPIYKKTLGGMSAGDLLIYSQGTSRDYNMWAKLTNESSWLPDNVIRLFKKVERLCDPIIQSSPDRAYHGFNGKLFLSKDRSPADEKYFTAFNQVGKKYVGDLNINNYFGVTGAIFYNNMKTGPKNSAQAYLTPVRSRPNLHVVKNILVTKILFDSEKRATAVTAYTQNKKTVVFRANNEIILTAGTYNTAKLLQLSGIGTKELLNAYKIPVVNILPVGLNYKHKVATVVVSAIEKTKCTYVPENNSPFRYTSPTIVSYASVNNSKPYPEYGTSSFIVPVTPSTILLKFASFYYRFNNTISDYWYKNTMGRESIFTLVEINYPESSGQVKISTRNPLVPPIIEPNFYSKRSDVKNMISYVKDFMKIFDSECFKSVGAYFVDPTKGSCGSYEADGDDYWECYIRCLMSPSSDQCGTAALGTVVDGRLRVKGVKGLRVADASIIPQMPPGSLTGIVLMIGENAAEMIKQDNGYGATFDFIVVGAGSAGSVVASRLVQDSKTRVLLIEAGGDPPIESNNPSLLIFLGKSYLDWNYTTENDGFTKQCHKDGNLDLMLGKMLGGSSSCNYILYSQGHYRDYDNWAEKTGDPIWSWNEVLPYFIKALRLEEPSILNSDSKPYYGTQGPLGITKDSHTDFNDTYLNGFEEAGNEIVNDLNAKSIYIGYSKIMYTLAEGIRQSTAYAYLRPFKDYPNFYVLKNTEATKILFDDNKNAVGVETINKNGDKLIINAAKEVIVSAGAINSPKLLMLSGIGPKNHLKSKGVPVISDLPVGKNFQDHIAAVVIHNMTKIDGPIKLRNPAEYPAHVFTGYVNLDKSKDYPVYSTVNYVNYAQYLVQFCAFTYGLNDEICDAMFATPNTNQMVFTVVTNLRPESRGEILLRSPNYADAPIIKAGYFSEKKDLENLVKYIEDFVRVTNTSHFKLAGAEVVNPKLASCSEYQYGTTDYWRCYARCMMITRRHYAGTVSMGTVLDSRLRVKGVNKLRVVDASVMPSITSGDPYVPTVMIGEKAADIIKKDNDIE